MNPYEQDPDYSMLTTEQYDDIFVTVLKDETMENILQVPGVRELLAAEYDTIVRALWVNANYSLAYPSTDAERPRGSQAPQSLGVAHGPRCRGGQREGQGS